MLRTMLAFALGRLRLAIGWRGGFRSRAIDLEQLVVPDSKLARAAEKECETRLSPPLIGHSHRSFAFAWALAGLDGVRIDLEELYVGALLHDIALESPSREACFAVAGGRRARSLAARVGAEAARAERLAEAITAHITPGVDPARHPLASRITVGALVDLTGSRLWHLDPLFVAQVVERHPRDAFGETLARAWRHEARTFPEGRAAAIERFSRFSFFVRHAPFGGAGGDGDAAR